MNFRLLIKDGAQDDIQVIRAGYEAISETLAQRFVDQLLCLFTQIENMPVLYAVVEMNFRQVKLKRFPHVITYTIDGEKIVVLAVLHGRRKSKHWRERLN